MRRDRRLQIRELCVTNYEDTPNSANTLLKHAPRKYEVYQ